jgi:NAD(P)-dependent dehydrogenase (short-subunit alcohol dehydrogenase family)
MNILITGCSTGIGEACARWLDRGGHRVFAGVRREADAERLRTGASGRLTPITIDVTDAGTIELARETIEQQVGGEGLGGLVNNAGIAVTGPLEYLPIEEFRRQLDVNVVGQLASTQAFLPLLRRAGGRVVFMGSIAGRMTIPFLGPYSASKFALEAIADALRLELQPWGIQVALIEPGSIATPIWTKGAAAANVLQAGLPAHVVEDYGAAMHAMRKAAGDAGRRGISPDAVARAVEHALTARVPKTRYLVGSDARFRALLMQIVPDRLRDRLITRAMKLPRYGSGR